MTVNTDILARTSLLHQKVTESGFALTDITTTPDNKFKFAFVGPKYANTHEDLSKKQSWGYPWMEPPWISISESIISVQGNRTSKNESRVFNSDTPALITGHFAHQVMNHITGLNTRRIQASHILQRLGHMTRFLKDGEQDWPKRRANAVWGYAGINPNEQKVWWRMQCGCGTLEEVPVDLVLETRNQLEKLPKPCGDDATHVLNEFFSEVAWARHILAFELPPIPKVPAKFRSFSKNFHEFKWTPIVVR